MELEQSTLRVRVLAGGDTLRTERLTRKLHNEINAADGLAATYAEPVDTRTGGLHKGAIDENLTLCVAFATAGINGAAWVLVTLIKEWCGKARDSRVELSHNGSTMILSGDATDHLDAITRLLSAPPPSNQLESNDDESDGGTP